VLPLRFEEYSAASARPNVVVDGSGNEGTVLTLSHWPGSPTPVEVRDDLSAQIAFHALGHADWFGDVEVVTNNHFDQDGLCSVYALTEPSAASAHRDLVIDVAGAGDFGVFRSRDAARIAFAIAALEDEDRSPLDRSVFTGSYGDVCGRLYVEALPRLAEMLDHPDRFRPLWEEEDAHLTESLAAIESGVVRIEERPDVDLAVVTVPPDWAGRITTRFTQQWTEAVHPVAVNNSTDMLRVLLVQGHRYRLELRYESWVMLTSRPVAPRPDLRDLAARLDALEPAGARWKAAPPGALTPHLELVDPSSGLAPARFVEEVAAFLATAPPAWDPFAAR
jgi:hypothetical protein